jgi:hypothetical protein
VSEPWILDVDTTVKPLYGHQEGAVVGYNAKKPGRPSHCYHTYSMAGTRLVLDVDVSAGDEHASNHSAPGLWAVLDRTPLDCWPSLLRGDIRRRVKGALARPAMDEDGPPRLAFLDIGPSEEMWEYQVLATTLGEALESFGQLYRDRGDGENVFDELKNQWGWGGFVTHDLARCRLAARLVALFYDWWNIFTRLAEPGRHREAIT